MTVHSYDEWSRLKEVIVGSPMNFQCHNLELSFKLFLHDNAFFTFWYPSYLASRDSPDQDTPSSKADSPRSVVGKQYLQELTEDIEEFVSTLTQLGVKVFRPKPLESVDEFSTPYWKSSTVPALNVRDQALILGQEILETAPQVRTRFFENDLLKPVFYHYFRHGARWTVMPRPLMTDKSFDLSYAFRDSVACIEKIYDTSPSPYDVGFEMMIDGAQCLRLGRHLLVNVANENHELACQWLARHLEGRFSILRAYRLADHHIDSMVLPLRPGMLLLRSPEVKERLPAPLKNWDCIYCPEPKENMFPTYDESDLVLASKYIDLNVLSVDDETVIVNAAFPELARELERHGFTPITVRHRHRRIFGGGFHCFTLDMVREGGPEDYLS